MLINNINLNAIRIFVVVYKKSSMTQAAKELNLTQSGVSQHIKNLESSLNLTLFYRKNRKLYSTKDAQKLFAVCEQVLKQIEVGFTEIAEKNFLFSGEIRLGLPVEFGNNMIIPLIARFKQLHPQVTFHLTYAHAAEINHMIISGTLDFALIDQYTMNRQITQEEVYRETLNLCCHQDYLKNFKTTKLDKNFYQQLDYIAYVPEASVLRQWFDHHYHFENFRPKLVMTLMDVQGVAKCIEEELGVGILPTHLLRTRPELNEKLHVFNKNKKPAINIIKLAYLEEKLNDRLISEIVTYFKRELARINTSPTTL